MSKAAETFESHFSLKPTRIHRFPHYMRGIGGADGRYMVPSRVAIGPYHRGWAHLQETEELKPVVAHRFCRGSGRSVQEVYDKILSVTEDARGCYTTTDGSSLVADLTLWETTRLPCVLPFTVSQKSSTRQKEPLPCATNGTHDKVNNTRQK